MPNARQSADPATDLDALPKLILPSSALLNWLTQMNTIDMNQLLRVRTGSYDGRQKWQMTVSTVRPDVAFFFTLSIAGFVFLDEFGRIHLYLKDAIASPPTDISGYRRRDCMTETISMRGHSLEWTNLRG